MKIILLLLFLTSCGKDLKTENKNANEYNDQDDQVTCYEDFDCRLTCQLHGYEFDTKSDCISSFVGSGVDIGSGLVQSRCAVTLESCFDKIINL